MDKILIVDDEKDIADLVSIYLENEGYTVHKAYNASDALLILEKQNINLAVLDIMLPDMSGFVLCKTIRQNYTFPIIMLTAKVEAMDKIQGLTFGADDYMTKPFNPLELTARVKAQLRRCSFYDKNNSANEKSEFDIRGLYICSESRKCQLYGKEISLTPIEFDILWYLCQKKGFVVSSEELFESVWKEKYLNSNNTLMSHIARIREKLSEPPRNPKFIKTVWGVGYTIE